MPLYEYSCASCGTFELLQKFSDAPLTECPTCGKPVNKLMSRTSFQLKGTGWYATDYKKPAASPAPATSAAVPATPSATPTTTETKPAASKPAGGESSGSGSGGSAN